MCSFSRIDIVGYLAVWGLFCFRYDANIDKILMKISRGRGRTTLMLIQSMKIEYWWWNFYWSMRMRMKSILECEDIMIMITMMMMMIKDLDYFFHSTLSICEGDLAFYAEKFNKPDHNHYLKYCHHHHHNDHTCVWVWGIETSDSQKLEVAPKVGWTPGNPPTVGHPSVMYTVYLLWSREMILKRKVAGSKFQKVFDLYP